MKHIFAKDFKSYFTSGIGYAFLAFSTVITGIFTFLYNIVYQSPNFEVSVYNGTAYGIAFFMCLLMIPILTMKTFAEERKQKTDQLLYSLPVKTSSIVLGKFFSAVAVFAIPVAVMCVIPPVLSLFGDVNFAASYSMLLAFFLLGVAFISIGVFVSSLTESMVVAVVITLVFNLVDYLLMYLVESVSESSTVSAVALLVLSVMVALVVYWLSKNEVLSIVIGSVLVLAIAVVTFVNSSLLSGFCPALLKKICLYNYLSGFVDGIFSIPSLVALVSIAAVFVYLTVQSLEKRRWA